MNRLARYRWCLSIYLLVLQGCGFAVLDSEAIGTDESAESELSDSAQASNEASQPTQSNETISDEDTWICQASPVGRDWICASTQRELNRLLQNERRGLQRPGFDLASTEFERAKITQSSSVASQSADSEVQPPLQVKTPFATPLAEEDPAVSAAEVFLDKINRLRGDRWTLQLAAFQSSAEADIFHERYSTIDAVLVNTVRDGTRYWVFVYAQVFESYNEAANQAAKITSAHPQIQPWIRGLDNLKAVLD